MDDRNGNKPPEEGPGKSPAPTPVSTAGALPGAETSIMKILSGIKSALGLGQQTDKSGQDSDVSTKLAYQRTNLATERNYLAADRTLMAWIRTSLSMISFGFTIGKLGQVLQSVEVQGTFRTKTIGVESIAYFLTILGTLSLLGAAFQHWIRIRQLRAMGLRIQISISFIVALILAGVGGFALSALVLAL
jgi:putative membrane protein